MDRILFVGDMVILDEPLLGNTIYAKGVVYEEYDLGKGPGASIIFENGNYDGFSPEEQDHMVQKVGHCAECENYVFTNVMHLSKDFDRGYFLPEFT